MSQDGNDKVADFILEFKWDDAPENVQQRARLCLLDALGAALGGALTPVSRIAAEYASTVWRGDPSTIFLHGKRAQPAGAAFANACAANGLDIDDDAIFTRGHPGAQLIPAALAVAEHTGAGGKALLEALIIGYETAIRTGRGWHDRHETYQSCGSWGSVACAAAASRLLLLNKDQLKHALGIAEYHAPNAPMMRDIDHPAMVKHAIGWGAMNGVVSAELAGRGFTGIPSLLGDEAYREWVCDIGERYWMADWVFYKGWASCAWGHAACEAALMLTQKHEISVDGIEQIRVRTFREALRLHLAYPANTEEAQFSVKWPLACLLLEGEIGPNQVLEHRLQDPAIRDLFDRIEVVLDPEIDRRYQETQKEDLRMYSAVEIRLKNGQIYDSGTVERGAGRWDKAGLERKFRWLVGHVLGPETVEKLVLMVSEFECIDTVTNMTHLLQKSEIVAAGLQKKP
jgi:2-methylcitrate dehydratase PrpD